MPTETRERLGEMQAALVTALAGRGAPPHGFDVDRIEATASALATKRLRAMARAWPGLAEELGGRFEERFRTFAATTLLPRCGGPLGDGRAFLRWLAKSNELCDAVRLQALAVDLRYIETADGLARRRWPAFKIARLRKSRRLVVAVRFPSLGEQWLAVRTPSFRG